MCVANCPPSVPVRMFLAPGAIGTEIARFAATHETDVIALVRSSPFEPGHGKVLREVLDHAMCPILIVSGVTLTSTPRLTGGTWLVAFAPE
jgi:hypothetical protein